MFGGGTTNPYDDIVNKTTDENLTSENWELILNLCDKVQDEGQEGAHSVIAAVLKRLAHRNPNVQLYALSLAEALSKNCTIELHREIASRAFTQGLEKIITDRTTHEKVKRRALGLIAMWTSEFESDSTLGIMEECYNNLKQKNYKFEAPQEAPPPTVDDEIRRKEEEELQRVLEMSMQDKGGRNQWQGYSAASSSGAGGSGSSSNLHRNATASASTSTSKPSVAAPSNANAYAQPTYQAGYVPARTPSPKVQIPVPVATVEPAAAATPVGATAESTAASVAAMSAHGNIVTRVRALHTFEPTEPGELAFEKGDVIKVVDRGYKDWWRGQLKGRTGIFPVNYVEAMPEPTASELAKEAEQEAAVFAQAVNVEKLLNMLRSLDPAKDNLADNEEIQELYRSSMALRPKIVKLIDKYSQKRADLVSMNETFVRARSIFDRMMEESLARHTGVYEQSYRAPQYPRSDSRAHARPEYSPSAIPGPQAYGWNPNVYDQPGYNAYPAPAAAYPQGPSPEVGYAGPGAHPPQGQPQYVDPNAYAQQQPQQPLQQQAQGYVQPYAGQQPGAPYGPQGPTPYPVQVQQQPQQQPQQIQPQQSQPQPQAQPQPQQHQPQHQQPQQQQQPQQSQHQQHQPQIQPLPEPTPAAQPQPQLQTQAQAQPQAAQVQATQPVPQQQTGPPYVYDPNHTYADPNVQAWAQYYAQGGKDTAGAVYFISIPGVTDSAAAPASPQQHSQSAQQHQQPQSQQPAHDASPTSSSQGPLESLQGYPGPAQQQATQNELPGYAGSQSQLQTLQSTVTPASNAYSRPAASTTPSWVLPRNTSTSPPRSPIPSHTNPRLGGSPTQHLSSPYDTAPYGEPYPGQGHPPSMHDLQTQGGSPQLGRDAPGYGAQYYGLPNQFAGMGVTDNTTQSPHSGGQHQAAQGVGAPA